MKHFKLLILVVLLVGSLTLSGCSTGEDAPVDSNTDTTTSSTSVNSETETVVESSSVEPPEESSAGVEVDDKDAKKAEARERILAQRQKVQNKPTAGTGNVPVPSSKEADQLANTGLGLNVFIALSVFTALAYVGVRRKYLMKGEEPRII
jgi:hypothetical protein